MYDKVQAECSAQLDVLRPDIPDRIISWHTRLDDGYAMLAEEKAARKIVINRERLKLLKTVDDFEKQLEIEKVERLERETLMVQKVSQEVHELQEVFDGERLRRETVLGHERDENDQIDAMRDRPDEVFKAEMVRAHLPYLHPLAQACKKTAGACPLCATERMQPLTPSRCGAPLVPQVSRMMAATKDIRMETAIRLHAEQQFVAALESYTRSLQGGLRMVNKNPPKVAYTTLIERGDEPKAPPPSLEVAERPGKD